MDLGDTHEAAASLVALLSRESKTTAEEAQRGVDAVIKAISLFESIDLKAAEVTQLISAAQLLTRVAGSGVQLSTELLKVVLNRTNAPAKRLRKSWKGAEAPLPRALFDALPPLLETARAAIAVCDGLLMALRTTGARQLPGGVLWALLWKGVATHAIFLAHAADHAQQQQLDDATRCIDAVFTALFAEGALPGLKKKQINYLLKLATMLVVGTAAVAASGKKKWTTSYLASLGNFILASAARTSTHLDAHAIALIKAVGAYPDRLALLAMLVCPPRDQGQAGAEAAVRLSLGACALRVLCKHVHAQPQLCVVCVELAERLVLGAARCHAALLGDAEASSRSSSSTGSGSGAASTSAPKLWCNVSAALDACAACAGENAAAASTKSSNVSQQQHPKNFARLWTFIVSTIAGRGNAASGAAGELVLRLMVALLRAAPPQLRAGAIESLLSALASSCADNDDGVSSSSSSNARRRMRFRPIAALAAALERWFRSSGSDTAGMSSAAVATEHQQTLQHAMRIVDIAPRVMRAAAAGCAAANGCCATHTTAAMLSLVAALTSAVLRGCTAEADVASAKNVLRRKVRLLLQRDDVFCRATAATLQDCGQCAAPLLRGDDDAARVALAAVQGIVAKQGGVSEAHLVAAVAAGAGLRHQWGDAAKLALFVSGIARQLKLRERSAAHTASVALEMATFDLFVAMRDVAIPAMHRASVFAGFAGIFASALRRRNMGAGAGSQSQLQCCEWTRWPLALDALHALAAYGALAAEPEGLRFVAEALDAPNRAAMERVLLEQEELAGEGASTSIASAAAGAAALLREGTALRDWRGPVVAPVAKRQRVDCAATTATAAGGRASTSADDSDALVLALQRACDAVRRASGLLTTGAAAGHSAQLRSALARVAAASKPFAE
tara:strand:- start:130 stop:2844 length:2715 start_codon:yes stop_codon:yes gene_type:complete